MIDAGLTLAARLKREARREKKENETSAKSKAEEDFEASLQICGNFPFWKIDLLMFSFSVLMKAKFVASERWMWDVVLDQVRVGRRAALKHFTSSTFSPSTQSRVFSHKFRPPLPPHLRASSWRMPKENSFFYFLITFDIWTWLHVWFIFLFALGSGRGLVFANN